MDENLQVFADETEDLLLVAEAALLKLDNPESDADTLDCVNDLFRTFHTIKGAAGLFGFDSIVNFTHIVESVLVQVREGRIKVNDDLVSLLLANRDHLEFLIKLALNGGDDNNVEVKKRDNALVEQLNSYLKPSKEKSSAAEVAVPVTVAAPTDEQSLGVANDNWHISLRFGPNALRNGMDPASFISYLTKLGELTSVTLMDDALPPWEVFDPESCYLGFELELNAPDVTKEELQDVFEFVQDDCKISILPPHSHISAYIKLIEELSEDDMRIGDILVACGALTEREKDDVLSAQESITDAVTGGARGNTPPLGVVAVEQHVVQQAVVDAAIKKQGEQKQTRDSSQQTIRVNALKLENLVNLVGELVIGSANTELKARKLADVDLNEAMENMLRLVEEVRDTALGLRMVPIGETFDRYKRVVREVSRDLGKNIDLQISGADTELDKTLVEKIGDPLMHLVRNAIDHGIESPERRLAAGKPAQGVVKLDALHDSGSILIRISDDGGGLSKSRILKKAVEKGIIQEGQKLTDQEIYRLIFEAGFSTAETVSNISGRGVGMDVVRRNIEALRGHVEIDSEEGRGSVISIRLPLTLAIIDGFQVRVGDSQYIVPLDMVHECIELNDSLRGKDGKANYINLRGEILPFVHLSDMFGLQRDNASADYDGKHRENIVVVQFDGKKSGFVVDELLGEHQTVIKPLGRVFQNLRGISGTTILGGGEVAMIIDIPQMIQRVASLGQGRFGLGKAEIH